VPQWPQNRLPAEFWWPQLAQVSTKAAPQAPQKFWSSGLSLPQLGHRTPVLVCVAVDSPFTSLPRDLTERTISLTCARQQGRRKQMLVILCRVNDNLMVYAIM
jgi:hypothetical protein